MVSGGKKCVKNLRRHEAAAGGSDLRPGGYPLSSRTLVWHSSFRHPKSRHEEILHGHALNQQLEICFPGKDGLAIAQSLKWETSFYYEITTSLSMFLSKRFIAEYILQGCVYMIAKNVPVDSSNTAMLLSTGELLLLVDSSTYEQLGLIGEKYGKAIPSECRPSAAHARRAQRYLITLDLKAKAFASEGDDTCFRDRVVNCLETKFAPLEMLVCAYNERGSARTITFGDDDTMERKRVEVNGEWTHVQDVVLPQFEKFYSSAAGGGEDASDGGSQQATQKTKEELVASLHGAYDWFGLVACRLTDLLKQQTPEEYVSMFTGVPDMFEIQSGGEIATVRWRGLLVSEFCKNNVLEKAAQAVKSGKVPWAAVMVWGFPDALVSWTQKEGTQRREHGYLVNGSNHYTVILLPNEEYFLLQSLGAHDATM